MVTLNKSLKSSVAQKVAQEATINYEGAIAYKLGDKTALIEHVLGAFWAEDLFYQKGSKTAQEIVTLIKRVASKDPKFILQLAAFARNEIYMRTTPQVLLVEAANIEGCKPFVREYTPKIVKRADELADVIAYQLTSHGKPIPNALKKGLAEAFSKFDEYQLNKYDSDKASVKLGDVLRLIERREGYPVSKAMYNYLVNDIVDDEALPKISALKKLLAKSEIDDEAEELIKTSSVTWETLISKFGSTKENWELVVPNMGYMALLRNLRNFEEKDVDLGPILERIADPEQVKRSKQLPFRFWSAYKNTKSQKVRRAIAKALEASITNVNLPGSTAVIIDLSGSMSMGHVSSKSDVTYAEIGAILGAIAVKKAQESIVIKFGDTAKVSKVNPDDTIMTNMEKLQTNDGVGHSTHASAALQALAPYSVDRVILLSDMQCYGGSVSTEWKAYLSKHPKARLYSYDLSAYGTSQFPSTQNSVTKLNGWSDKILDFINLVEKQDIMEQEIKKY